MTIKQQSVHAAAVHIISAPSLSWIVGDEPEDLTGAFARLQLRGNSLSEGERVLKDIARAIYHERGGPHFTDLLRNLDDDSLKRVIEAICALRPGAAL